MKTLSLQCKPVSSRCDMRCAYCFFADGAGGGRVDDRGVMSAGTLEAIVARALSEAEERCDFQFTGGEPTLAGLDFFQLLVDLENKHNARNIAVTHTLRTNGLALDDAWADFLAAYNFVTVVSIDADKKVHDAMRPDAAGKGTHNRAVLAARRLAEREAEFSVASVVTRALASHPDRTFRYFGDRGFRHAVFQPYLDAPGAVPGSSPHALSPEVYGKFLNRLFDIWYHDFIRGGYLSIRMFDVYVHLLAGHEAGAGEETSGLTIEADGAAYPDETRVDAAHRLGDATGESFASLLEGEAMRGCRAAASARRAARCGGCVHREICHGGNRVQRELGGGDLAVEEYCDAYKAFFDHARPRMELLAKALYEGEKQQELLARYRKNAIV